MASFTLACVAVLALAGRVSPPQLQAVGSVVATRLAQNPLVTVASSPTLAGNVNGPSVVGVPEWLTNPLGRYYMYFAHHKGEYIRLAYADSLSGPWRVYEPGVLHVRDTAFHRPLPDPPDSPAGFYTHVASPEVFVDQPRRRILMWFHGWWTDGQRWPVGGPRSTAAWRQWANANDYGQYTQLAESRDGLTFSVHEPITRASYLRVFAEDGALYAMVRAGRLARTSDPLASFTLGPNPFDGSAYAGRVRHVALLKQQRALSVFFSAIGDAPERILMSTVDLTGDWTTWRASPPIELLRPEAPYECADAPNEPSRGGAVEGRVRQMRDPAIFEEEGRTWLLYTVCGEQGIAAAELTFSETRR